MADNQRLALDYYTPDRADMRRRSRDRAMGIVFSILAACVIGGSLAERLGLPGVTLVMGVVAVIAAATLFICRSRFPKSDA